MASGSLQLKARVIDPTNPNHFSESVPDVARYKKGDLVEFPEWLVTGCMYCLVEVSDREGQWIPNAEHVPYILPKGVDISTLCLGQPLQDLGTVVMAFVLRRARQIILRVDPEEDSSFYRYFFLQSFSAAS